MRCSLLILNTHKARGPKGAQELPNGKDSFGLICVVECIRAKGLCRSIKASLQGLHWWHLSGLVGRPSFVTLPNRALNFIQLYLNTRSAEHILGSEQVFSQCVCAHPITHMFRQSTMFEQAKEAGTFSNIPIKNKNVPLLARLKTQKPTPTPPRWPDPEQSIGKHRWTFGERKFWDIIGPGLKQLAPLLAEATSLLHTHNEYLKEREASTMFLDLFMVGKSEASSCPTLLIICTKAIPRQRVVEVIRRSEILDKYPGVLLGACSKHPRDPLAGSPRSIAFGNKEVVSQTLTALEARVYIKKSDHEMICGTSIYIPIDNHLLNGFGRFRRATIGGFLDIKSKDGTTTTVGMTAAHAFEPLSSEDLSDSSEDSKASGFEFEFEFVGPSPEECWGDYSSSNKSQISCKRPKRDNF